MSCHSFARTLMDETGYGAGGRWRVRLPLGVWSPRMSLIGWPRRTLDCRHGEAVLAVEPADPMLRHLMTPNLRTMLLCRIHIDMRPVHDRSRGNLPPIPSPTSGHPMS